MSTATVTLFKPSGKYYTMEEWSVPADALGPEDMLRSPDFHRIDGGPVYVHEQAPWGYDCILPGSTNPLARRVVALADAAEAEIRACIGAADHWVVLDRLIADLRAAAEDAS